MDFDGSSTALSENFKTLHEIVYLWLLEGDGSRKIRRPSNFMFSQLSTFRSTDSLTLLPKNIFKINNENKTIKPTFQYNE